MLVLWWFAADVYRLAWPTLPDFFGSSGGRGCGIGVGVLNVALPISIIFALRARPISGLLVQQVGNLKEPSRGRTASWSWVFERLGASPGGSGCAAQGVVHGEDGRPCRPDDGCETLVEVVHCSETKGQRRGRERHGGVAEGRCRRPWRATWMGQPWSRETVILEAERQVVSASSPCTFRAWSVISGLGIRTVR